MKKALICGIGGQDGAYLTKFLLAKGYEVYGTSRDAEMATFSNLTRLGLLAQVKTLSMAVNDFRSVLHVMKKVAPDEVYNLSGQSSVGLSFEQPVETMESISGGTLNLLEAIKFLGADIKLYNAGSSECFGDTGEKKATEKTPFHPCSPYAVAKSAAHWQIANYREAYGMFACTGIMFNHESCLRPSRFVTRKIVEKAILIANGSKDKLRIGNTGIIRDWGWAPEYVEAMWLMLQSDVPKDYVVGTGKSISLKEFIDLAFKEVGLNWRDHTETDTSLFRPNDHLRSCSDPEKIFTKLGWKAKYSNEDVVRLLIKNTI
ncbi:MAG: GDP-mannose 4,6-dehydratase [Proteobacteria bacterium]|nr:GDP-mannose 4,6-dehydratase [Pseudomonadota bacterium]MBU1714537.1 GDP-mannose 4,6-dehydratase [Pseudomonadota bacterium]